jgi:DNA-binding transcriptional ArsR family regulator
MVTSEMRGEGVSEDELFRLLANERRRYVIEALAETSAPIAVSALAREVARRECDGCVSLENVTAEVHTMLIHSHLPKLDAAGVITQDRRQGTVTRESHFADLSAVLERVSR